MKLDILIKNGLVADLEGHDYINRNIGVIGDRIVDLIPLTICRPKR